MIKPLVAGNWKMNGLSGSLNVVDAMEEAFDDELAAKVDVMICPPSTLISRMKERSSKIAVGAQDCHVKESGAHTGDLSAAMLVDSGASAVIVGHSERRADHGESDDNVREKAEAVFQVGAKAIICVGEMKDQRENGDAIDVVMSQLQGSIPSTATAENTIIAYEPVWAIGTGLTPTAADVKEMHGAIRKQLTTSHGVEGKAMRILYGGSVKPSNADELMAVDNVNGALVGGASLKAEDFAGIFSVYR